MDSYQRLKGHVLITKHMKGVSKYVSKFSEHSCKIQSTE